MEEKLIAILNEMAEYLSVAQLKKLQEVLLKNLSEKPVQKTVISNEEYLKIFLDAKKIEGCSERTLDYLILRSLRLRSIPYSQRETTTKKV